MVDLSTASAPISLDITFASDTTITPLCQQSPVDIPMPIQLDQICHLSSILETGEELKYQAIIDFDWASYFDDLVDNSASDAIIDDKIGKVSKNPKLTRS